MHLVNDQLKRLEPKDTKCIYCGIEHSQHMNDNYFVPLFREQDRTNVIVYRSVKYQKLPIGIPRCKNCLEVHEKASTQSKIYAWALALLLVIMSFAMWGIWGMFSVFVGIFVGFGVAHLLENKLVRDKGVLTKLEGAKENATVQNFIINGWTFNQPAA